MHNTEEDLTPQGIKPDTPVPEGISFDLTNPKYRQYRRNDSVLEYTLESGEITVDWVDGTNVASMMKTILHVEGADVTRISGYVTDKLGSAAEPVLDRLATRTAQQLGVEWTATIEAIEGRRYLVFEKRG